MESRRVLSGLVGVLSIAVPSVLGCAGPGGWDPLPLEVTPPPTPAPTPKEEAQRAEPPAISGGTLTVMAGGLTAVAADSDRDVVWIVDLDSQAVSHVVRLQPGDEPGRVVEDASGRVHVIARRGGALVSIDPLKGTILARRTVCPVPRGLAYDGGLDALHVACADGRLFTFPAGGGNATDVMQLDSDLRDVIVQGNDLYVTTFRAAEVLQIVGGMVVQRTTLPVASNIELPPGLPPPGVPPGALTFSPAVAWRTVAMPGGGLAMLHQRGQEEAVSTQPGGYTQGGGCPGMGIVEDVVTIVHPGTTPPTALPLGMMAAAVDVAVTSDGTQVAVASPGNAVGSSVVVYPVSMFETSSGPPCVLPPNGILTGQEATAVAFDGQNNVVVQIREPAGIFLGKTGGTISLPGASVANEGHSIFHTATKAGIACMSCHPEAGDDGRVWQFVDLGPRRTQNIRGGVLARTPFHWSGDIPDMDQLVTQVLVGRMGGNNLDADQTSQLAVWMDEQPALAAPAPSDPAAVARGKKTFEEPSVGCATCHNGPQLSDHHLVDVGTGEQAGEEFKVPSLIAVGYRAPYLHNGCAATLQDRFSPACDSGNQHGNTQQLSAGQIDDLVSYLQSL
jgi:hypothetical protein